MHLTLRGTTSRTMASIACLPRVVSSDSTSKALSKWSSIARLLRPVMNTSSVMPPATASSTAYWMSGLSTTGNISLGLALVAGKNRVPSPATGKTALVITLVISSFLQQLQQSRFVEYSNPQLLRLVQLAAGVRAGDHEISFLRHAAADAAAAIAYFLRGLVARQMRQSAGQHKSLAVDGAR